MRENVQARIVAIRNEQRAQKKAVQLGYGQLVVPDPPRKTWSGAIDPSNPLNSEYIAKFKARFTRTDGVNQPPLVDFSYTLAASRTNIDARRERGNIIAATDIDALLEGGHSGWVSTAANNYTEFSIVIRDSGSQGYFMTTTTGTSMVALSVTALSPVPGILTIERVYS